MFSGVRHLKELTNERINAALKFCETVSAASDARLTQRMDGSDKAIMQAFIATEKAMQLALDAQTDKAERHNALIQQMKDQSLLLQPRAEAVLMKESLEGALTRVRDRLDNIESRNSTRDGKGAGITLVVVIAMGVLTAVLTIVNIWQSLV